VEITNSYAVPFEEDAKNPKIWFLDHNYHENMWAMFRKVNAAEKVIGWYSTGPKIKPADLDIHELVRKYCPSPVLVIIDVRPTVTEVPTQAYVSIEEVSEENQTVHRFHHVPAIIGALEAEEVGVEHLLREVKDTNISTLTTQINDKILGLKALLSRMIEMQDYINLVISQKLPMNHTIIRQMQEIFNLIPNLNNPDLLRAFMVKNNDTMLAIYVSSLIRSVTALHNLINNKIDLAQAESDEKKEKEKEKEEKDKAKEEKDKDGKEEKKKEKETNKDKKYTLTS
jgi:26S proteasome regulatory subunit N8